MYIPFSFHVAKTGPGVHTAIPIVLTFLMSLVLGVLIGALSVLGWHKYHGGKSKDNSNEESRLGEGDARDLFTSIDRNPSYQHIQARSGEQSQNEITLVHSLQPQRPSPGIV